MNSSDSTKSEWNLDHVKGQILEGNEYAVEICEEVPDLLYFYGRENNEWVTISRVLIFDALRMCDGMTFAFTQQEYDVLSKSKASIDKFIEELACFDAMMFSELYEEASTDKEVREVDSLVNTWLQRIRDGIIKNR